MVKFSKELEARIIPEWREAFVKYRDLKKQIKKIKLSRLPKQPEDVDSDFGLSIFDAIRHFARNLYAKFRDPKNNTDIIQVRSKSVEKGEEVYETELSQLFSEEDEIRMFFWQLDEELGKVNQFYNKTESELLERGDILNKQLQVLLELKQMLNDCHRRNSPTSPNSRSSPQSWSSPARSSNFSEGSIELVESPVGTSEADEGTELTFVNPGTAAKTKQGKLKMAWKQDLLAKLPTKPIAGLASIPWEDLLNNRKKVQHAEKTIRKAFVELYKGLNLLKTYSSLNMEAFTKILKKFDKVSNMHASANYLKAVKESPFISSDKVVALMDDVESIFTKHFANNERKQAMKFLRPQQPKTSHMVTFFVGLFTGSFVSLFTIYAILGHLSGIFSSASEKYYMETIYPVFSMFALLSLHLFMYGCNLFLWKSTRINYNFIFQFSPHTSLKHKEAFLICTTFMTVVVGALAIQLLLWASTGFSTTRVDIIPGTLLVTFFALLICPFNIFYRSTRYCFLRIIRNIICSPFYKGLFVDFFLADQLTSQIPLLRCMEHTACYFVAASFRSYQYETCRSGRGFRELSYVISFLPYYWRAMQCARRWFDECEVEHLANMGKYVSAMVAAGARLIYQRPNNQNPEWLAIVLVTSAVATVYQLYWDFVRDWGLFNRHSRNLWLRDDLILKRKSIYYMSIAFNIVLRVAWVETVIGFKPKKDVESHLLDFLLASLEVIRRGHWNFYRLENEHIKKDGNYKAMKEVSSPF